MLLAADLLVEIDEHVIEMPGDSVTRVVRFFNNGSEDAVNAILQSRLTDQLENPIWTRHWGYAQSVPEGTATLAGPVLQTIRGVELADLTILGDLNADSILDFGITAGHGPAAGQYIVFGNLDEVHVDDIPSHPTEEATNHAGVKLSGEPVLGEFADLGDVNGDGINDLGIGNYVLFGSSDLGANGPVELDQLSGAKGFQLERAAAAIGDFNTDGFHDILTSDESGHASVILGKKGIGANGRISPVSPENPSGVSILKLPFRSEDAVAVGDINADGFQDFGIDTRLFLGGQDNMQPNHPGSWINVVTPITPKPQFFDNQVLRPAGDVNGDGIDDLLVALHGTFFETTASGKSITDVLAGAAVVFGDSSIGNSPTIEADGAGMNLQAIVNHGSFRDSRTEDRNADGMMDIVFTVDEREFVLLDQPDLTDIDLGALNVDAFNGENGTTTGAAVGCSGCERIGTDVNEDGLPDVVERSRDRSMYTVSLNEGSRVAEDTTSGDGDIFARVTIPTGRSLIYEVTGILRPDAQPNLPNTMTAEAAQKHGLPRNSIADGHGVDLSVKLTNSELQLGERATFEISIENFGQSVAPSFELVETISQSLEDPTWTLQTEQVFPSEIELGSKNFGSHDIGFSRVHHSSEIFFREFDALGHTTGRLGDINGDGFEDFFVGLKPDLVSTGRNGVRVYLGGTDFGDRGSFADSSTITLDGMHARPLGDLDRDGFDDFLLMEGFRQRVHAYWIVYGQSVFPRIDEQHISETSLRAFRVEDEYKVAGDLNGDGEDDVIVGSRIIVDDTTVSVSSYEKLFPLGDVNADGFDDLAAISALSDGVGKAAFVLFGGENFAVNAAQGEPNLLIDVIESFGGPLFVPDGHHDLNGDGIHDFVFFNGLGIYFAFGSRDLAEQLSLPVHELSSGYDTVPLSDNLIAVGDFNGDGADDLATVLGHQSGYPLVYFGGERFGDAPSLAFTAERFHGGISDEWPSVAAGFDANGDGLDDLLLGNPSHGGSAGMAYLVFGRQVKNLSGNGTFDQATDVRPGERIVIRIEGTTTEATLAESGNVRVDLHTDQLELNPVNNFAHTARVDELFADLDGDAVVGFSDFLILSHNFGLSAEDHEGDLNGDGIVDFVDYLVLEDHFGRKLNQ